MLPYLPVRDGQQPQHFKTRSQEAEKVLGLLPGTNWSHMGRPLGPEAACNDAPGDADGPALAASGVTETAFFWPSR